MSVTIRRTARRKTDRRDGEAAGGARPAGDGFTSGGHGKERAASFRIAGHRVTRRIVSLPPPNPKRTTKSVGGGGGRFTAGPLSLRTGADGYDRLRPLRTEGRETQRVGGSARDAPPVNARTQFRSAQALLSGSQGSPGSAAAPPTPVGVSMGADPGWPDTMKRDLQACKTPTDLRAWSEKWAGVLGGSTGGLKSEPPTRPEDGCAAHRRSAETTMRVR